MTSRHAHLLEKEDLASWENEGGAQVSASRRIPITMHASSWLPSSVVVGVSPPLRGADRGIADTHTLTIMRTSLLLLLPMLGVIATWSLLAASSSD